MDMVAVTMIGVGAFAGGTTITLAAIKLVPKLLNGRTPAPEDMPATRKELAAMERRVVHTDVCDTARAGLGNQMSEVQKNVRALMRHFKVQPPEEGD